MAGVGDLSPEQLTLLAAAIAVALADGLNDDETNELGNFLSAVGQNLQLIAARQTMTGSAAPSSPVP